MEDMARLAVVEQSLRDEHRFRYILYELLHQINLILENPHELRTIKNNTLKDLSMSDDAFSEYLKYVGFQWVGAEVIYPKEQTLNNLKMSQAAIERKISFCYGTPLRPSVKVSPTTKVQKFKPTENVLKTTNPFLKRIEKLFNNVLIYEDEELLELAREAIPMITLQLMALDRVREVQKRIKDGEKDIVDLPFDIALLMELMGWFKHKFFTWVDKPPCEGCKGPTVFSNHYTINTGLETCKMELYHCKTCGAGAKFVRYNDPRTLLRTRRGRCGEWANCFALLCRALGYETRYVYDPTDHVWCEIFDYESNTWLHADPCEAKLDAPLLYSHGWGKQISYVIAVSKDDVQDVTWRYSMDHKQVMKHRNKCTEQELIDSLLALRADRQRQVSEPRRRYLAKRSLQELADLMLERKPKDDETHGRISGSDQWRAERGELGRPVSRIYVFRAAGRYEVSYCTAKDLYQIRRDDTEIERIAPWSAGVYDAKNVFRKVENDWEQVYLARSEGAITGELKWKLFVGDGLQLSEVIIRANTKVFKTGRLVWKLQWDDEDPLALDFEPENLATKGMIVQLCCRVFTICVQLSGGGAGGVAWQYAQLGRQPAADDKPAFSFTAVVKPYPG